MESNEEESKCARFLFPTIWLHPVRALATTDFYVFFSENATKDSKEKKEVEKDALILRASRIECSPLVVVIIVWRILSTAYFLLHMLQQLQVLLVLVHIWNLATISER